MRTTKPRPRTAVIAALLPGLLALGCGDTRGARESLGPVGDMGDGGSDESDGADDGDTGDDGNDGDDGGDSGGNTGGGGDTDAGTTGDDGGTHGDDGGTTGDDGGTNGGGTTDTGGGGNNPMLDPPAGESSGGSGGPTGSGVLVTTSSGYQYRIIVPGGSGPFEFLLVLSGVEGGSAMTSNLLSLGGSTSTSGMLRAVIDGQQYFYDENVGGDVLDDVRAKYDVDNDRTYLLSESAGTISGMYAGMVHRQSYFAAYWANDINASTDPVLTADDMGFAPYGNCGPGGEFVGCNHVVSAMQAAGYRTPAPAPYDGPGAGTHGDINQFIAALSWFKGKRRQ